MIRFFLACFTFFAGLSTLSAQVENKITQITAPITIQSGGSIENQIIESHIAEIGVSTPVFRGVPISLTPPAETSKPDPGRYKNFLQIPESAPPATEPTEKTYLLLGQNETLKGAAYRFEMRFGEETAEYHSEISPPLGRSREIAAGLFPQKLYRPVWKLNDKVLICRFDFRPIRFLLNPEGKRNPYDFRERNADVPMAPVPSFPGPISLKSMGLRVAVNGKPDGFSFHASLDGNRWYPVADRRTFQRLFPTETIYLRIAADSLDSVALSVDALLNMPGGVGAGDTLFAKQSAAAPSNEILWHTVFRDEAGDLCMIVENKSDHVFDSFFYMGHITAFACADGGYSCLPVPAQSTGVLQFSNPKRGTGGHTITLGNTGFGLQYGIDVPDENGNVTSNLPFIVKSSVIDMTGQENVLSPDFTTFPDTFTVPRVLLRKAPSAPLQPVIPGTATPYVPGNFVR